MPDGRPKLYLRGLAMRSWHALPAQQRGVLPSGFRPFNDRTVLGSRLDDGVHDAGHLGGESGHRLAASIRIVGMPGNIAPELVAEAVVGLPDRNLGRHPEGASQSGAAVLRQLGSSAEQA